MTTEDLTKLKDFLMDKLRFFNQGFANVYLDELTGLIYQGDSFEKFAVGINDSFGNYFYIRTEANIDYSESRPQVTDSSASVDEALRCYLVAVVDKAQPKELVQAILNALLQYGSEKIRPVRAVHHRETAVAKELAKIGREEIKDVLQRLGSWQVVILEFSLYTRFTAKPFNCIPSPCNSVC
ncbi:hypothetical protein [Chitinophaga sp. YIM B06452]|uniref:hypothetical protein n=1 Tax=Chitinophaga sp. YIM B06452 TaxID=3082158 RepID=UPI0031FE902B